MLLVSALLIGVLIQTFMSGVLLPSISHYFYTPAHNVFVAALVAASLALTALAGRDTETILLDVSAVFAPLIALVPTGIAAVELPDNPGINNELLATYAIGSAEDLIPKEAPSNWCSSERDLGCVPDIYMPGIHVSLWTYIAVILAVIVLSLWIHREKLWDRKHKETRRNESPEEKRKRRARVLVAPIVALAAAAGVGALAFLPPVNDGFPFNAPIIGSVHFTATLLFFSCFALVPLVNYLRYRRLKKHPEEREDTEREIPPFYARVYVAIPIAMAADLLLLGIFGVWLKVHPWVLIGEFGALLLFAIYWAVQTIQRWNERDPDSI